MHWKLLHIAFILPIAASLSPAQPPASGTYSDPRFPEELASQANAVHDHGVKALEKREDALKRELELYPPLESRDNPPLQYFGYLSERHPVSTTNDSMAAWVQLSFFGKWTTAVNGIALVPAYYPAFSPEGNYGFPKRFKIDVFSHQDPDLPVTVVDWSTTDFPDPGLHPVFFSFPQTDVQSVRLTVTKGERKEDSQFFALDELMVFQNGNNIAPPSYQGLTASDSYNEAPYWKLQYLTDRKVQAGKNLHTIHSVPDFIQYYDEATIRDRPPEIEIDLGAQHNIGRVELYPAKLPGMPIPEFAFPLKYQIDLRRAPKDNPIAQSSVIEETLPSRMRWHPLSSTRGRFLRLTLHELPRHSDRPVFAMGEIRVIGREGDQQENLAVGKTIRMTGLPAGGAADSTLLVDGYSNGREIIQEHVHIEQLAARKMVAQALAQTQHRLVIARATRQSFFWMLGISGGIVLFFSLILWIAHQRTVRQRALDGLRQQIAADLHDDISSNLGTISMITKRLQQDPSPSLVKGKLNEISHIAQESFLSIKEIIWHMDSDVVHFTEMFKHIEKTARSILGDSQVICRFPDNVEDAAVPAKIRRNIMLLVKEALYNCAKYAQAEHMLINADMRNSVLELSMKDDGCGFDPACTLAPNSDTGRGLANMERRARLLGAELDIFSEPGKGTQVTLRMPIT
jgi:signal transduction histidine kinase